MSKMSNNEVGRIGVGMGLNPKEVVAKFVSETGKEYTFRAWGGSCTISSYNVYGVCQLKMVSRESGRRIWKKLAANKAEYIQRLKEREKADLEHQLQNR